MRLRYPAWISYLPTGKSDWALHRQCRPVPPQSGPWQPVPPHSWKRSDCNRVLNERRVIITLCLYSPLPGPGSPETACRAVATGLGVRLAASAAPARTVQQRQPPVSSGRMTQEHACKKGWCEMGAREGRGPGGGRGHEEPWERGGIAAERDGVAAGWRSGGNNELCHTEARRWKNSSQTASWNLRRHLLALRRVFSSFSSSFQILYSASESWFLAQRSTCCVSQYNSIKLKSSNRWSTLA
jgi:hypothetical protein